MQKIEVGGVADEEKMCTKAQGPIYIALVQLQDMQGRQD